MNNFTPLRAKVYNRIWSLR